MKTITEYKKVKHEYNIEDTFEAGIELHGWEVKALRSGNAQLTGSYVIFKNNEAFILGSIINPLQTSLHENPDASRTRKLLLKRSELNKLIKKTQQKGYTALCYKLYWKAHLVKAEVVIAKGKNNYDKRLTQKERDIKRSIQTKSKF